MLSWGVGEGTKLNRTMLYGRTYVNLWSWWRLSAMFKTKIWEQDKGAPLRLSVGARMCSERKTGMERNWLKRWRRWGWPEKGTAQQAWLCTTVLSSGCWQAVLCPKKTAVCGAGDRCRAHQTGSPSGGSASANTHSKEPNVSHFYVTFLKKLFLFKMIPRF